MSSELQFVDSFEHYGTNDVRTKWTQGIGNFGGVISGGRNGKGFQINAGGGIGKTLSCGFKSQIIVAFAFKLTGETFGNQDFINIYSTGANLGRLRILSDGTFAAYAFSTLIFNADTFILHPNTWYFVEFKCEFSGSTNVSCEATLWVDGDEKGHGTANTGVNALTELIAGAAKVNNFTIFNGSGNGATIIDDVYCLMSNSSIDNRGDLNIFAIYPNGDASPNDWDPVGGSGYHYTRVNEAAPDGDTTYLKSATVSAEENFDWEDVPASAGTIKGYQMTILARKDNEGSRSVQAFRVGEDGDVIWINDDYVFYTTPFDGDISPGTFNARTHGFRVVD